jgi:formate hydrogenlyase subunit 5
MSWKEIERELLERFENDCSDWNRPGDRRIRTRVKSESFAAVARFLAETGQVRFITATAMDTPGPFIEVWYHFELVQTPQVLSLLVRIPKSDLRVPSITPILPGADRIEREIAEMFGVRFEGHPRPGRLPLPEGGSRNAQPMRKE